jgi:hypothetical protein
LDPLAPAPLAPLRPKRPPNPPASQLPLESGEVSAIDVAATVPEVSVAPCALAQSPTFSAVDVTAAVFVIVVVEPTVIVLLVVVGVALGEVDEPVRAKLSAATVIELPETAVTLPVVIALAKFPPPANPERPPDGKPLGRLAPGVKLPLGRVPPPNPPPPKPVPPVPPARVQLPLSAGLTVIVVGAVDVAVDALDVAALVSIATMHEPTVMSARDPVRVCVIRVEAV